MSSSGESVVRRRMPEVIARMWRTASTMLPEPASPFVRIIAAPSPMRLIASPRSRSPQTNGTRNANLSMWKCSSAGVRTSDSSTKSTASASRIRASTKWPIRALAMTGIETVFWISLIFFTEAIRATPPSLRMSAGTRSSAITDAAPASSAIFACSAVVTSMITPPLSISARPMCFLSAILSSSNSAMSTPPSFIHRLVLHHWDGCGFEPAPASGPAPRRLDRLAEPPDPLVDPPGRHGRKRQPQRARAGAVHEERRARRERDAVLDGRRQELGGVEPGRQREEERESPLWLRPRHLGRHAAPEGREQERAPPRVFARHPRRVAVEEPPLAEPVDRRLDERARVEVGELLGRLEPLEDRRGADDPPA